MKHRPDAESQTRHEAAQTERLLAEITLCEARRDRHPVNSVEYLSWQKEIDHLHARVTARRRGTAV